jgi:hypothetical protein
MNQENILEVFSQDNNIGDDNNPETCIIRSKSYKTKSGLVQHENKKHFEYHEYPLNTPLTTSILFNRI